MKNHNIVSKYLLFKLLQCSVLFSSSAFSLPSSSSRSNNINNNNNIKAAVIVPGFLTGASEMKSLVDALEKEGIPSVSVPFPNWHWLPCLGGRSARPMLERIDYTVKHLACLQQKDLFENNKKRRIEIPDFQYSIFDCWNDFRDNPGGVLEVGGSSEVDLYDKNIQPRGNFVFPTDDEIKSRVILIGHSAGGWISRAYLSDRDYGGKAYRGNQYVHTLITLGTPHKNAPGAAFKGVEWINREGKHPNVRCLAVSGSGFKGDSSGQLTENAYSFCDCIPSESCDGDGLTPIESALAFEGAEKLILKGRVTHFPWSDVFGGDLFAPDLAKIHKEEKVPWYADVLDQYVGFIHDTK